MKWSQVKSSRNSWLSVSSLLHCKDSDSPYPSPCWWQIFFTKTCPYPEMVQRIRSKRKGEGNRNLSDRILSQKVFGQSLWFGSLHSIYSDAFFGNKNSWDPLPDKYGLHWLVGLVERKPGLDVVCACVIWDWDGTKEEGRFQTWGVWQQACCRQEQSPYTSL